MQRQARNEESASAPPELLAAAGSLETDLAAFAAGALKALVWAKGKAPGIYTMQDVLGLK